VYIDQLFSMMDLYHAASLALDRVKGATTQTNACDFQSSSPPLPPSSSSSSSWSAGGDKHVHVLSNGVGGMCNIAEICRMRNRDLPLPAIRIFAEGVLQLLRQSTLWSPAVSSSASPDLSEAESLFSQLDLETFIGDEANQRLANDVWIDLATSSATLRQLKSVLKAITHSYELIESFYRTAGLFPFPSLTLISSSFSCACCSRSRVPVCVP
jgi:hypothetical protein